ncbi:hypothetical protein JAAARDRAFT_211283 [Jaapia argillacea MUCL 33604]|uniref:Uncharacterized protein n=1 Tax=Jaapia argillacea MUCL 33604 TaxID=933084 RepID=A0A067PBD6_9AGAM|nr:hypothetical protein JAAARDRAFT_211283 [Jaapia argillacea MUCL 33604]
MLIRRPRSKTPDEVDDEANVEDDDAISHDGDSDQDSESNSGSDSASEDILPDPCVYLTWAGGLHDLLHGTGDQLLLHDKPGLLKGHQLLQDADDADDDPYYDWSEGMNVHSITVDPCPTLSNTEGGKELARMFDKAREGAIKALTKGKGKSEVEEPLWWEVTVWRSEPPKDLPCLQFDSFSRFFPSLPYWITGFQVADEEGYDAIEALGQFLGPER